MATSAIEDVGAGPDARPLLPENESRTGEQVPVNTTEASVEESNHPGQTSALRLVRTFWLRKTTLFAFSALFTFLWITLLVLWPFDRSSHGFQADLDLKSPCLDVWANGRSGRRRQPLATSGLLLQVHPALGSDETGLWSGKDHAPARLHLAFAGEQPGPRHPQPSYLGSLLHHWLCPP